MSIKPESLISSLFGPVLSIKRWIEIDFNECAKSFRQSELVGENRLLDTSEQGKLINEVNRRADADHTWGGYLEDRSFLWRDSYLPKNKMTHLGIDFNVTEGTWVYMPISGEPVFAIHDKDQAGGWGGRIDFWLEEFGLYMILGHLGIEAQSYTPANGARLECPAKEQWLQRVVYKGCKLGIVADTPMNGGWFPHLHLQLVSKSEYESHKNPMDIDGYGELTLNIRARYPNPKILAL